MAIEQVILSAGVTIFSLGLLIVSLASYWRFRNVKLLVISFVFVVFLVKGVLMSLQVFTTGSSFASMVLSGSYSGVLDVVVLVLLFVATLKR
ncbi:MAG: hypothetical protein V1726_01400 [Methanobacteriota archaeon]